MEQFVIEADRLEEWARTSFVDDNGQVFMPCGAFGDEQLAMLCAAFDGVSMVQNDGHIYAPASWLKREYPRHARAIETIAAEIIERRKNIGHAENE